MGIAFVVQKREKKIEQLNEQQRQTLQEQLERAKLVVVATKGRKNSPCVSVKRRNN